MQVSTSSVSQGEVRWPWHHCAADESRRYQCQGHAMAASTAVMVIYLLTVSKAQQAPGHWAHRAWGTPECFLQRRPKERRGNTLKVGQRCYPHSSKPNKSLLPMTPGPLPKKPQALKVFPSPSFPPLPSFTHSSFTFPLPPQNNFWMGLRLTEGFLQP